MIIRPGPDGLLLITQPDHAELAARIMRRWRRDGLDTSPRREAILLAVAEHDNGWREVDATPLVEPDSGRLLDFISAPNDVRRGVWPRGVARLAGAPYAAALVAQHALHIYRRYGDDPAWRPFFTELTAARDQHLYVSGESLAQLCADYRFVRLGDLASLAFCNAWTEPQSDAMGYTIRFDGARLGVSPDPFDGAAFAIAVRGRSMPDTLFASAQAASDRFARAPVVEAVGIVSGSAA